MTSRNNIAEAGGFTLLEMIVVIAIMGLTLVLVADFIQPHSHRLEAKAAAETVAEAMRDARGQAIAQSRPIAFALPRLPAGLAGTIQAPAGGIVFAADGSSSGGLVLLQGGGQAIAITTDWLTGRVRIDGR